MKIKIAYVGVFLVSFLIGSALILPIRKTTAPIETADFKQKKLPLIVESKVECKIIEENLDWQEDDESRFKIKLLETGEGFHGDEIEAKSGELWLGLFKVKDKYFLRQTKITVRRSQDAVANNDGERTSKDVLVNGKTKPVFLLKNAEILKEGQIQTVFHNSSDEDLTGLSNGFSADYVVNGKKYTLRTEGGENSSRLILETENIKQVLFYVDKMGDATWNLVWAGDLDGDGKLDLYANLPTFYNFLEHRLFLSSQAENGKLIKQVAVFHTSGC